MIVLTPSWELGDVKIYVLKADYEAHRIDVCAEAAAGDFQIIHKYYEQRMTEILPANGIDAVCYFFNVVSDGFLHIYNPVTNTCETCGRVEEWKITIGS